MTDAPALFAGMVDAYANANPATIADARATAQRLLGRNFQIGEGAATKAQAAYAQRFLDILAAGDSPQRLQAIGVELRRLHITEYAMGKGGWGMLTPDDRAILIERLRSEFDFFANFVQDIQAGNLSDAEIAARMQLYINHSNTSFWSGVRAGKAESGHSEERRILNPAEHCTDCVIYAAMDWQPIGTLPVPGDASECRANCVCEFEYR